MIYKSLYFYNPDVFLSCSDTVIAEAYRIYIPYKAFADTRVTQSAGRYRELSEKEKTQFIAVLPYINKGKEKLLFEKNFMSAYENSDGFMLQNIGDKVFLDALMKKNGCREKKILCGDYSLNVLSSGSADFWASKELQSITLLPEAKASELISLADSMENILPEIICGGRIIVMRSEHCFISDSPSFHCDRCGKNGFDAYSLADNNGNIFPIIGCNEDCQNIILSAKPININCEMLKKQLCKSCILRYNILNNDDLKEKGWLQL